MCTIVDNMWKVTEHIGNKICDHSLKSVYRAYFNPLDCRVLLIINLLVILNTYFDDITYEQIIMVQAIMRMLRTSPQERP